MKQKLSIEVRGKQHNWSFIINEDPKYLKEWRDDDLIINEVYNVIPEFIVNLGLIKIWCFFEDIFNFRNPFSK